MAPLYRSDSLDSLVSSDDLDQASLLIRFRSFLFLFVFVLLILVAIACSLLIEIPIKVSGPAVIWSDDGVLQVTAEHPGTITSIKVKVGDRVGYNQTIAVLDQKSISDKLFSTQEKLEALNGNIEKLEALQKKDKEERAAIQSDVAEVRKEFDGLKTITMNRLRERKEELKKLHEEGLIQFDQYNLLFDQIEKTEESLLQEKRMALTEKKEEQRKERADERELLQKRLDALQLESEVTLLHKQIDKQGELRSHISGRVVEITSSVGDFLSPGSPVILVQPDSGEDKMTFVVFISSEQAKPVKVNMDTELQLSAFPPTKYGKLMAKVKDVSPMPLSSSGLMKELRNDQLVQRITEVGSPFMVKVDIVRDEQGEFKWSSQSDGERELQVGMVGQGSIITRWERLIWLLLPQTQ
ncbi:MAG: NHLP bacteriocin system secretion protein [Opitutae bacterium]|nr:NHLP bacteriocin system secretion protein [Opitutae bacterium]